MQFSRQLLSARHADAGPDCGTALPDPVRVWNSKLLMSVLIERKRIDRVLTTADGARAGIRGTTGHLRDEPYGVIRRCRAFAEGAATFTGRHRPASYWRRQEKRGKMK